MLARLQGRPPASEPEAELWIGAHPHAPSSVTVAGRRVTLDRLVADRPAEMLGPAAERFGPELPFLLKVLAVAEPPSIQAHPSLAQAAEGFAREQQAGIAPDAPNRNYRDRNHNPELAVALVPYWMMSGFRPYLVGALQGGGYAKLRRELSAALAARLGNRNQLRIRVVDKVPRPAAGHPAGLNDPKPNHAATINRHRAALTTCSPASHVIVPGQRVPM